MRRAPAQLQGRAATAAVAARARGLTLIELLVGLALTALLLVTITAMLRVGTAAGAANAQQLDLQEQLQFAMRRLAQRIEQTPATMLATKDDDASSGSWLQPALYDLRPGSMPGTVALFETVGPVSSIIAEPVAAFSMTSAPVGAGASVVNVALRLEQRRNAGDAASVSAAAAATLAVRLGGAVVRPAP